MAAACTNKQLEAPNACCTICSSRNLLGDRHGCKLGLVCMTVRGTKHRRTGDVGAGVCAYAFVKLTSCGRGDSANSSVAAQPGIWGTASSSALRLPGPRNYAIQKGTHGGWEDGA